MELTDWSDLRQFDDISMNINNKPKKDEQKVKKLNTETTEEVEGMKDSTKSTEENNMGEMNIIESVSGDKNVREMQLASGIEINNWGDVCKLEEDYNDDWYSYQEGKLAKQYGGNFIKVKYASHGRVLYLCELCVAECNAKSSLELHCHGMKHLKKKDLWEKEGRPPSKIGLKKNELDDKPPPRRERIRSRDRGRRRSESRNRGERRRGRDRSRSRDRSSKDNQSYKSSRRWPDKPSYDRDRYPRDNSRAENSRDFAPPDRGFKDNRGFEPNYGFEGAQAFEGDRAFDGDRGFKPDQGYGMDGNSNYDRWNNYTNRQDSPGGSDPYGPPPRPDYNSPVPFEPPPPPKFREEKAAGGGLSSSLAGGLLSKLSECCVKSSDDADFALSVVAALTKSLKEYSKNNGETKISELLMEAELKIGTVKALKVGMKMLSSFADNPKSKTATQIANDFIKSMTESSGHQGTSAHPGHHYNQQEENRININTSIPYANETLNSDQKMKQVVGYPSRYMPGGGDPNGMPPHWL